MKIKNIIILTILLFGFKIFGQDLKRPFILVTSEERNQVLEKNKIEVILLKYKGRIDWALTQHILTLFK